MKKLFIVLSTILLLGFTVSADSKSLPEVAVTPDHPLYDAKLEIEKQIVELSQDNKSKAKAKLDRAKTRLAEVEKLVSNNQSELANKTAGNYSEIMRDLKNLGDQMKNTSEKREIDKLVANATSFHTEVLSKVYEKVPEEAKKGIANALNASVKGHQKAVQALNRTGGIPKSIETNVTGKVPKGLQGKVGTPGNMGKAKKGKSKNGKSKNPGKQSNPVN